MPQECFESSGIWRSGPIVEQLLFLHLVLIRTCCHVFQILDMGIGSDVLRKDWQHFRAWIDDKRYPMKAVGALCFDQFNV